MNLLGSEVRPVSYGSMTLKDATLEAIRDWVTNVESTYYLIGSTVGPHPYPMLVRDFQSVIGQETKQQFAEQSDQTLPDRLVACVGGGSNALGLFYPFLQNDVKIVGVEAAGKGLESGKHAATLTKGEFGVLQGAASALLQNEDGQERNAGQRRAWQQAEDEAEDDAGRAAQAETEETEKPGGATASGNGDEQP